MTGLIQATSGPLTFRKSHPGRVKALAGLMACVVLVLSFAHKSSPLSVLASRASLVRPTSAVDALYSSFAADERKRLVAGLSTPCEERSCAFNDVAVSLPLSSPHILQASDGSGQGTKAMLNPETLFGSDSKCLVYGLGISTDSSYEVGMSRFCETHAFDCTIPKDAEAVTKKGENFHFHQTCVGPETGIKRTPGYGGQSWDLVFKPLKTVMHELGHSKVDVLKFDIEGSEVSSFLAQEHGQFAASWVSLVPRNVCSFKWTFSDAVNLCFAYFVLQLASTTQWNLIDGNILDPEFLNPPRQVRYFLDLL